jgi:DNA helicase-2/ATP-dependent DNA helicase PcrA
MYVGVTRAETKLYITTAKRRQMWGEYKYYSPSRFLDEIPVNLIDEEQSAFSEYTSDRSTFRNAVKTVSKASFHKKESSINSTNDGYVKPSTGFGASFVAPSTKNVNNVVKKQPTVQRTPARAIIKKNPINKEREEEKIRKFFEDNIIKRKLEEKKKEEARLAQEQAKEQELKNTATQYFFNIGERVFHEKLGIGHITDVIQIGDSTMYTIDFGKLGKKAMDAAYAHLKKF